ncbi:hypothetical protein [Nocardia sp. NPDC050406]|uniref:hypothetical protein n=1 Tax=Nocardia sp. NPDC050406 TaxID=3364318 RepID=UPI0037AD6176
MCAPGWGEYEQALHALRAHQTCHTTTCRHKAAAIGDLLRAMRNQADEAFGLLEDAIDQESAKATPPGEFEAFTARLSALSGTDYDIGPEDE